MQEKLKEFVASKDLFLNSQQVLVAVSGGIDSVALAHLLKQAGYDFGLAHCNFQLRGKDSDLDADLVTNLAGELEVPYFQTCFDTIQLAETQKKSIQVIARELRYEWLEKIRVEHNFDFIATAHHADDSLETILYNWTKGTGLKGLTGIPLKKGKIVRPLLFASKKDIEDYVERNGFSYREDASNLQDKYSRNKIRHHVIPVLKKINPGLIPTIQRSIQHLKGFEYWFQQGAADLKQLVWSEGNDQVRLNLEALQGHPYLDTLFHEWLSPYGLNSKQSAQLAKSLKGLSGKQFYTKTHRLLVDRNRVIIEPLKANKLPFKFIIDYDMKQVELPGANLEISKHLREPDSQLPSFGKDPREVCLQLQKTDFPLTLRHWLPGDHFKPLGMKGKHQKLQDFFNNQKVSRFEKEKIWILETAQKEICWVVGYRIAEPFKLTSSTSAYTRMVYLLPGGH